MQRFSEPLKNAQPLAAGPPTTHPRCKSSEVNAAAPTDTTAFLLAAFNDDSCLATTQFADILGTDILKEGFVFESIAGQLLRTSISPRTAVGALVVALLKMVTTIRFHGALS